MAHAAEEGLEGVVQLLLAQEGIKVNEKDKDDKTPLAYALEGGHEGVVQLLRTRGGIE